jgi:hypothetical protein
MTIKWEIFKELDYPCADISYQWITGKGHRLVITMHFSRVIGGCPNDLELTFYRPIAFKWDDEVYSSTELPEPAPMCTSKGFTTWIYPTLVIPNSSWALSYALEAFPERDINEHGINHVCLISMNDILEILSEEKPSVRLVEPADA